MAVRIYNFTLPSNFHDNSPFPDHSSPWFTFLLHTFKGSGPRCKFMVSLLSTSHPGCDSPNSYHPSALASTTVCSKYEMLLPIQPLAPAEKATKYG